MKTNNNDDLPNKDPFEAIMDKVGRTGRFQWTYIAFMTASAVAGSLIYMNIILALNVPNHWCHVPGRNETNLTESEWKHLTLPLTTDNRGEISFSSCEMYNISYKVLQKQLDSNYSKSKCLYGYDYDKSYYDESIPSKENWVCDKELYVTEIFTLRGLSEIIGAGVLGYIGDTYGRHFVFCISVAIAVFGRILTIFTTSSFAVFLPASALALLTMSTLVHMPYIIVMEISNEKRRAHITLFFMISWAIATCVMALIYSLTRHWYSFMWITTIPAMVVFVFVKYMIESPRWLINQKKFGKALQVFNKIAKMNGKKFTMTESELEENFKHVKQEKVYGFTSLFSHWRVAKNTIIIETTWCIVAVSFFTLTLFTAQMGGNPFLNFFLQSVVEIPALFIGKYLSNTIGRRLTNFLFLILSGVACIPIIFLATDSKYENIVIGLTILVKFINCITNLAASLQEVEMYPTCLRTSGMSLGTIMSNAVSCLSPFFVYLGTNVDFRAPYYILATLFIIGGSAAMFLPETLNEKLPDTLEEAKYFGKDQKFWSLPSSQPILEDKTETEMLNMKTNEQWE